MIFTHRCNEGRGVSTQVFVMVADVKSEREENVVPNEHLHLRLLAGIDRHHVAVDDGHRAARGRCHEVAVNLLASTLLARRYFRGWYRGSIPFKLPFIMGRN